jgi:hypothetical protein
MAGLYWITKVWGRSRNFQAGGDNGLVRLKVSFLEIDGRECNVTAPSSFFDSSYEIREFIRLNPFNLSYPSSLHLGALRCRSPRLS